MSISGDFCADDDDNDNDDRTDYFTPFAHAHGVINKEIILVDGEGLQDTECPVSRFSKCRKLI